MSVNVFANGMEIACKAASGKSAAAMPDVCLSPPSPPAGPVPIPYPNTAQASDTSNGSTTVMICGQEVMLKDQSVFKKSTGNEAATKSLGMGVVTHAIQGEASFVAWSMDVKFEGANVPRHLDLMVHNEQSTPPNTAPWGYASTAAGGTIASCQEDKAREESCCSDFDPPDPCEAAGLDTRPNDPDSPQTKLSAGQAYIDIQAHSTKKFRKLPRTTDPDTKALRCLNARRCRVTNFDPNNCCPGQTADHIVPKASFLQSGVTGWANYNENHAPCMCAEGKNNTWGSHGYRHAYHKSNPPSDGKGGTIAAGRRMPFSAAVTHSVEGVTEVYSSSGCNPACIEAQVKKGHKGFNNVDPPKDVKYVPSGRNDAADTDMAISMANDP